MNSKSSKSPLITWMFYIFGAFIGIINAILTAVFSYTYLPAAFGDANGMFAPYLAATYGLLIMDIAYIAWFYVYLRIAESRGQRSLSIVMAILSLSASIMATVTQLVTNSFGLVDFTAYNDTVGITAMVFMIAVTALHIISFAAYTLLDPEERIKTAGTDTKADFLEDVLAEAQTRLEADKTFVVDALAAKYRRSMLAQLGFTVDYQQIGAGDAQDVPQVIIEQDADQALTRRMSGRDSNFYHSDQEYGGRVWFATEEEARKSAAALSTVWNDNIEVFRKDGTVIAEYGGPSGSIDLMDVGRAPRPTQAPITARNGNGNGYNPE